MSTIIYLIAMTFGVLWIIEKQNRKDEERTKNYWYLQYLDKLNEVDDLQRKLNSREQMYKNLDVMEEEK